MWDFEEVVPKKKTTPKSISLIIADINYMLK